MATRISTRVKPRRVDPDDYPSDALAVKAIRYGLTAKAAARMAGLTVGQVQYRYHKAGISPLEWRNGGVMKRAIIQDELDIADDAIEALRKKRVARTHSQYGKGNGKV